MWGLPIPNIGFRSKAGKSRSCPTETFLLNTLRRKSENHGSVQSTDANLGHWSEFLMIKRAEKPSAHVEVVPVTPEQELILANLLELYAHDFSEFHDVAIGADGRFGYNSLPLYWSEPGRHPFLAWVYGELAGFVLVKRGSEFSANQDIWDMTDFFVLRGYRRRGIGTQIAHEVWKNFPGSWEVRVMQSNAAGQQFWAHAISTFTDEAAQPVLAEKDGKSWNIFLFES